MNLSNKYLTITVISFALAGTAYAVQAKDSNHKNATAASTAKVTMATALDLALKEVPGFALEAEFENDDGKMVWEIEIFASSKAVHDIKIDAITGKILNNEIDSMNHDNDSDDDSSD